MANGKVTVLSPEEWQAAKDDYIYNGMSQQKIAEKYKISPGTIGNRAAREKWTEEKRKVREKACNAVADTLTQTRLDGSPEQIVENTAILLLNKLAERFETLILDDMTPTAMKAYASTLKDLKEILKSDDSTIKHIEVVFNNAGDDAFNE